MKIKEKIKKFFDNPTFLKICKFLCVLSFGVIIGVLSMCDCKKVNADSVSFSQSIYNYNPFNNGVSTLAYYNGTNFNDFELSLGLSFRDNVEPIGNFDAINDAYYFYTVDNSTRNQFFNIIELSDYSFGNVSTAGTVFYSVYIPTPFTVIDFKDSIYFRFVTSSTESELVVVQVSYEYYNGSNWVEFEEFYFPSSETSISNYNFTRSIVNPTIEYNGTEFENVSVIRNFDLAFGLQYVPYEQSQFEIQLHYPLQTLSLYEYVELNDFVITNLYSTPDTLLSTLLTNVSDFMAIEVLPGITFLGLLGICISIPLTLMVLKIWLGG